MTIALGFAALFALLFLEVPIGFAMAAVSVAGFAYIVGWAPALAMVGQISSDVVLEYGLSVVPLFILMGNLVNSSGLSRDLYDASNAFLGHRRGGLAMATVVACGGFASVCGSSVATVATMTPIAMPAMRRYGYAPSLSAGSIAAGGTLGILIPPSVPLAIYGGMTETDIGKLFIAGVLPGLLLVLFYVATVFVVTAKNPSLGPRGEKLSGRERLRAFGRVYGVAGLFVLVIGGIYAGVFTPTEAAGIGASGAFLFACWRGLTLSQVHAILVDTARTTSILFMLLIGAFLFTNFVNVSRLPNLVADWIAQLGLAPTVVIIVMLVIYVFAGCILETVSIMLLSVPIFFPIILALGYDPIWFGIVLIVVLELGLITPPIGLNVFVIKSMLPDVGTIDIFKGALPFVVADLILLVALVAFPSIALYLPSLMD